MKHTLISLDLALFDDQGKLLEVLSMKPCSVDPCPAYTASVPFVWALEAPAGALIGLEEGARLVTDVGRPWDY